MPLIKGFKQIQKWHQYRITITSIHAVKQQNNFWSIRHNHGNESLSYNKCILAMDTMNKQSSSSVPQRSYLKLRYYDVYHLTFLSKFFRFSLISVKFACLSAIFSERSSNSVLTSSSWDSTVSAGYRNVWDYEIHESTIQSTFTFGRRWFIRNTLCERPRLRKKLVLITNRCCRHEIFWFGIIWRHFTYNSVKTQICSPYSRLSQL